MGCTDKYSAGVGGELGWWCVKSEGQIVVRVMAANFILLVL